MSRWYEKCNVVPNEANTHFKLQPSDMPSPWLCVEITELYLGPAKKPPRSIPAATGSLNCFSTRCLPAEPIFTRSLVVLGDQRGGSRNFSKQSGSKQKMTKRAVDLIYQYEVDCHFWWLHFPGTRLESTDWSFKAFEWKFTGLITSSALQNQLPGHWGLLYNFSTASRIASASPVEHWS